MTTEAGLLSITGPLRIATEDALRGLGYTPSTSQRGDVILTTILTSGRVGWLAEFTLHERSNVIVARIVVTAIFEPNMKPPEIQDLVWRLNGDMVFGGFVNQPGTTAVTYRTARDFADGASAKQITRFLNQLSFPLTVWREVCAPFPRGTSVKSRVEAALIRLEAFEGDEISRHTRRALLRVVRSAADAKALEPKPSALGLMLV